MKFYYINNSWNGVCYILTLEATGIEERFLYLSTLNWRKMLSEDIEEINKTIQSDGCTGVSQLYRDGCVLHDFWYRVHCDFDGTPISRAEADKRLREYIQSKSPLNGLSPLAWWRWAGVRLFGRGAWRG